MSRKQTKVSVNETTRRAATDLNVLRTGHTCLLGTLLTPRGQTAYVHEAPGKIRRVVEGDRIDGATVTAIGNGYLNMSRGPDSRQMRIPHG